MAQTDETGTRSRTSQAAPYSYRNWRAFDAGELACETYEWPLFSDAWFTGELRDLGPYSVLNPVAIAPRGHAKAALVLRGKLCAKERSDENGRDAYHGGHPPEEIAALLSLCTGARLKAGGSMRRFSVAGDPLGEPRGFGGLMEWVLPEQRVRLPRTVRARNNPVALSETAIAYQLRTFARTDPATARVLVKSARLYQDALWLAESEPHLAWLLLVSAVETAADHWCHDERTPVEHLSEAKPKLVEILRRSGGDELVAQVAAELANITGATRKFTEFILEFDPGPPPGDRLIPVDWSKLKKAVRLVYDWRSKALHGGTPFPAPMCDAPIIQGESPFSFAEAKKGAIAERPLGLAAGTGGAMWDNNETPMLLHVFEHITRGALLRWWNHMGARNEEARATQGE
jgi:hypothetical protein